MNLRIFTISFLLILPSVSFGSSQSSDIIGAWICGPYEIHGEGFVVSAIDRPIYSSDCGFTELGTATYTFSNGTQLRTEVQHVGSWDLREDLLELRFTSAKFLSSDSPTVTIADGQAFLDSMMERKNWTKKRILELGENLVTIPVESIYKPAEVQVSCSKA